MKCGKTVLFDLDGTLFRTETVDIVALNKALSQNGMELRSDAEILDCIGLTLDETCKRFGISDSAACGKFAKDVLYFEMQEIDRNGRLYDGADVLIRELKEAGFTVCLCSNGSSEYVGRILEKFSLAEYFDEIWPHREGYSKSQAVACLAEKYAKDGFIMIGDRDSDIDAGRENGGITVGMLYGFGGNEPFNADFTACDITELKRVINLIYETEIEFEKENELCVE
jgi:phosphoglycolate phosphatase-like HAD superfamily hydrolase